MTILLFLLSVLPAITWLLVIGFIVAVVMWDTRREVIPQTRAVSALDAPKGFLDLIVDAEDSGDEVNTLVQSIGFETEKMGKQLTVHAQRLQKKGITPKRAHSIASDAAADMNRYSDGLEQLLEKLRPASTTLGHSIVGYLGRTKPSGEADKVAMRGLYRAAKDLIRTIRGSRRSIKGYRSTVIGLRGANVTRNLNSGCDRLVRAIDGVVAVMVLLDKPYVRLSRMIYWRLHLPVWLLRPLWLL